MCLLSFCKELIDVFTMPLVITISFVLLHENDSFLVLLNSKKTTGEKYRRRLCTVVVRESSFCRSNLLVCATLWDRKDCVADGELQILNTHKNIIFWCCPKWNFMMFELMRFWILSTHCCFKWIFSPPEEKSKVILSFLYRATVIAVWRSCEIWSSPWWYSNVLFINNVVITL